MINFARTLSLPQTEQILNALRSHYQADQERSRLLPLDPKRLDTLIKNAEQDLADIDKELADAQRKHEQAQKKQIFTF